MLLPDLFSSFDVALSHLCESCILLQWLPVRHRTIIQTLFTNVSRHQRFNAAFNIMWPLSCAHVSFWDGRRTQLTQQCYFHYCHLQESLKHTCSRDNSLLFVEWELLNSSKPLSLKRNSYFSKLFFVLQLLNHRGCFQTVKLTFAENHILTLTLQLHAEAYNCKRMSPFLSLEAGRIKAG